jgi:hypothetical protein
MRMTYHSPNAPPRSRKHPKSTRLRVFSAHLEQRSTPPSRFMVRQRAVKSPFVMLSARPLTDQIIDNAIDLDPEYQRGKCLLVERIAGVVAGVVAGSDRAHSKRCCMAGRKAVWLDRFNLAQLLHSPDHLWCVKLLRCSYQISQRDKQPSQSKRTGVNCEPVLMGNSV